MFRLRKNEAIRELSCELGLISESIGSCRLQQGNTSVIVSVYGPVYGQNRNTSSNNDDSKTSLDVSISLPEESGVDINKVSKKYESYLSKSLSSCVILEGSGTIVIKVKVVRDDGSLLSVGIALYSVNYHFYLYYHLQILALNACTLALIDSGFPMYTLPVSISICGVLLPSSSISYYVDPSKDDEKSDKKFFNVFTFLVFSELSLSSQSTSLSRHNYEILKGTSTLIASESMGELTSDEFIKSSKIAMNCCELLALFMKTTVENHGQS